MKCNIVCLAAVAAVLSGCATLPADMPMDVTATSQGCGSPPHATICLGFDDLATRRYGSLFSQAAREGVDAVYTDAFERDLAAFVRNHAGAGAHAEAWRGLDQEATVRDLRRVMGTMKVTTYGGVHGWWVNTIYGNTAYDGTTSGPIRLNRAALPRTSASVANTFVHEGAHRIGLTHPHSNTDFRVALCEPPYVIGSLIQKQIEGSAWKPKGHCALLAD